MRTPVRARTSGSKRGVNLTQPHAPSKRFRRGPRKCPRQRAKGVLTERAFSSAPVAFFAPRCVCVVGGAHSSAGAVPEVRTARARDGALERRRRERRRPARRATAASAVRRRGPRGDAHRHASTAARSQRSPGRVTCVSRCRRSPRARRGQARGRRRCRFASIGTGTPPPVYSSGGFCGGNWASRRR